MWVHELVDDLHASIDNDADKILELDKYVSVATQTDRESDLATIEKLISSNRRLVLSVLGLPDTTHTLASDSQTQQLVAIPEFDILGSAGAPRTRHNYDTG